MHLPSLRLNLDQLVARFKPHPTASNVSKSKHKNRLRVLVPLGLLMVGAGFSATYFLSRSSTDTLQLSGRIEGYETDVGAKVSGRVEFVAVREGDPVDDGQVIVRLDDDEVQAQLDEAKAQLASAQQQERQAWLQIEVLQSQIRRAQVSLEQSQGDAVGQVSQAEANLATEQAQLAEAEAQLIAAKSDLELTRVERDRYIKLARAGAATQERADQAQTTFETTAARLDVHEAAVVAAQRQVNAAEGNLIQAQTTRLNPDIRMAELDVLQKQLIQTQSQAEAAQDNVARAEAAQREIVARMGYLTIASPLNGVVTARSAEPGEVVTTGSTLLSLIDLDTVYLRGFIPEGEIGKVRVGQTASIFLDSAPDQPLSARVISIDTQASFTPENIYFREDRVQQVFGVRLSIDNPEGFAKPGMPADGEIHFE
ncbi:HlyD family secretion protein [Leptolyngbya cf. ectocarpi LEGE 11479]|uniref:HlyD family secretion protein n=1 Tax=Leptolyngbya cf. ectocarpi LEGE 11479 TaxID=1828722 RepID=A0A929A0F5_LEPEC|nr:HlyD family efflux transporter periplasmic adaptor subunit [Leptolyngbya ectocarpi]MBE9070860.1 HlyD family secretion protein [Leptolyngbya cf. ectocarpi LEGE 11479]